MNLKHGDIVKKDMSSRASWTIKETDGKVIAIPNTSQYFTDKTEIEITEENEGKFVRVANAIGLPENVFMATPEMIEQSKKVLEEAKWDSAKRGCVDGINMEEIGKSENRKGLSDREMNSSYKDLYRRCRELDKTLTNSELSIVNGAYPELVEKYFEHFKKVDEWVKTVNKFYDEINQYFTPDIEDIRVGYECQIRNSASIREHWPDYILNKMIIEKGVFKLKDWNDIRVPYLTKEQIEAEGWIFKETNKMTYWYEKENPEIGGNWYGYHIYRAKLLHDPKRNKLKVLFSFDAVEDECVFEGECKSINEFKTLMKWLKM